MITEASYKGNIGVMEMMKLYQKLTSKEIEELEEIIKEEDWKSYKKIVKKHLGIDLK